MARVVVEEEMCAGNGLCRRVCPEVFDVVDGVARVKAPELVDQHRAAVGEAVMVCPTQALSIET